MALATLAKVKEYLEISGSDHDARLTALVGRAEQAVKSFTRRELEAPGADVTELHDGADGDTVFLDEFPIISVTSVHDDTEGVFGAETLIAATDYAIVANEGFVRLRFTRFIEGVQNIQVKYIGGFASNSIPKDLEMATIYLVAHWFEERKNLALEARALRDGGTSRHLHDFPPQVKEMLMPYVRRQVG